MVMAKAKQGKEKCQMPFQVSPAIPLAKGSHITELRINGQGNSDVTKGVPSGGGRIGTINAIYHINHQVPTETHLESVSREFTF